MKCPFCSVPCGNSHCPYYQDQKDLDCGVQAKRLTEENIRLKDHIKQLEAYIAGFLYVSDKTKK
jgi:hypothetical protein